MIVGFRLLLDWVMTAMHTAGGCGGGKRGVLGLPDDEPAVVKALFRRGQARVQLGDLRGAREDMKQAQSNADALTQQSIVNALYSVDRLLSAELVPVSTTRRDRAKLRRWLLSWRKLACRIESAHCWRSGCRRSLAWPRRGSRSGRLSCSGVRPSCGQARTQSI